MSQLTGFYHLSIMMSGDVYWTEIIWILFCDWNNMNEFSFASVCLHVDVSGDTFTFIQEKKLIKTFVLTIKKWKDVISHSLFT